MPITLRVPEMSCEGCEDIIENAVTEVDGVGSASADRHDSMVVIEGEADTEDLMDAVVYAGYDAELTDSIPDRESETEKVAEESEPEAEETEADEDVEEETDTGHEDVSETQPEATKVVEEDSKDEEESADGDETEAKDVDKEAEDTEEDEGNEYTADESE